MKAYAIDRVTSFLGNEAIDSFHSTMFHGVAERGEEAGGATNYSLGDDLQIPLKLSINRYRLNPVIQPSLNWVVSGEVKNRFEKSGHITLLKAKIIHAASIPYRECDFSHWDNPEYFDDGDEPERILLGAKNELQHIPKTFQYYEVICADFETLNVANGGKPFAYFDLSFDDVMRTGQVPVTAEMLNHHQLVYCSGFMVVSGDLYAKLKDYFDWNYFVCREVQLAS